MSVDERAQLTESTVVRVHVNGEEHAADVEVRMLLSDFLRHELLLTGTHVGCEHGVCGACTVLLDGEPVRSCLMFAVQADACTIETVEGMADAGQLHPIQKAFQEHHALQCAFCTPGFLMATRALLAANPDPSEAEIREYLSGNICRCTGYVGIVNAVKSAAQELADTSEGRTNP